MRNLNRLTNAANRLEHGPRRIDRRKLPVCEEPDCNRKVEALPDGGHTEACYLHMTAIEKAAYFDAWREAT